MAEMDDNADIETGADTLLNFLDQKNKWPVSKIADEMGVPEKTIKAWAKALEKSGLVEIKYSAIKGMVLEYSSKKSYDELSSGSSEVAIEADEIEIEADEIETVDETKESEERGDDIPTKTVHQEDKETKKDESGSDEEKEGEEDEEAESKEDENKNEDTETDDSDQSKEKEDERPDVQEEDTETDELNSNEEKEEDTSDEKREEDEKVKEEPNIEDEEGKEKLKNKLEEMNGRDEDEEKNEKGKIKAEKSKLKGKEKDKSQETDREEDDSTETGKIKAEKAKIKGGKKKEEREDNLEETSNHKPVRGKEEHEEKVEDLHENLDSKEKKEVEHDSGESLEDILDNLSELGDMLKDKDIDNSEVYTRMEKETVELKNVLRDESLDQKEKSDIANCMDKLQQDLKSQEDQGLLNRILELFGSNKKDEDDHKQRVDKLHGAVSSRKSDEVDHSPGEDFFEVTSNIKELGTMLTEEGTSNEEIYSRIDQEMQELKKALKSEPITNRKKEEIFDTMSEVEKDISIAEGGNKNSKSFLQRIKEVIT